MTEFFLLAICGYKLFALLAERQHCYVHGHDPDFEADQVRYTCRCCGKRGVLRDV